VAAQDSPSLPRLRQAVIAAHDLDDVVGQLRSALGLNEPFADPGVEHFGLRNAVFALQDTFLEVVSPIRPDTSAGRLLERRGGDCGYMLMLQVSDLPAARDRVRQLGLREVFEVSLDDMAEVHLHPSDMRGAIVSLSQPEPPAAWRWGGPNWQGRRAEGLKLSGATLTVSAPVEIADRWARVIDEPVGETGVRFSADEVERGLTEIIVTADPDRVPAASSDDPLRIGAVQFVFEEPEEEEEA
jgi:Glyoxalase-like domain